MPLTIRSSQITDGDGSRVLSPFASSPTTESFNRGRNALGSSIGRCDAFRFNSIDDGDADDAGVDANAVAGVLDNDGTIVDDDADGDGIAVNSDVEFDIDCIGDRIIIVTPHDTIYNDESGSSSPYIDGTYEGHICTTEHT